MEMVFGEVGLKRYSAVRQQLKEKDALIEALEERVMQLLMERDDLEAVIADKEHQIDALEEELDAH